MADHAEHQHPGLQAEQDGEEEEDEQLRGLGAAHQVNSEAEPV